MLELNDEEILYIKKRTILQRIHADIIKGMEDRIIMVKKANEGELDASKIPKDLHRTQARELYKMKKVEKMMKYFFLEERIQDSEWLEGTYPRDWDGSIEQLEKYRNL